MIHSARRIVDIHSHIGVDQAPNLQGSEDGNSMKGTSGSGMPWLRSLDGLNTHDDSIGLAIAGGLTTSLILPGSANAIGITSDLQEIYVLTDAL